MKSTLQKILIIVLLLFVSGCDQLNEEIKPERKTKLYSRIINVNGHILLPMPAVRNLSFGGEQKLNTIFEYSISENKLNSSEFKLPQNLTALVEYQGKFYGATDKSVATYFIREKAIEADKYYQTPKGDFIGNLLILDEQLIAITYSENQISINELKESEWSIKQIISINKEQIPQGIPTLIKSNEEHIIFWSISKNLYYFYLNQNPSPIKQISLSEISDPKVWLYNNKLLASGFDEKNNLLHYEISNLNTAITLTKSDLGNYPAFNSNFKIIDLLPIIINDQLKGFVYGAIKDKPIFITDENKTFPAELETNFNSEIKNIIYMNFGMLIAIIFLFATLAHKASNAWENKFAKLKINIPENSVFFGPAFNRGIAYLIDLSVMLLISLVLLVTLPFKVDIFSLVIKWALESGQIPLQEQTSFFILTYCVNIFYGTLTEYFFGQTLGKYCMGLMVFSDNSLKRLSFLQALLRNLIPKFPPNSLLLLASNITITFVHKKKSLNDYAGNSVVLYHRLHKKLNLSINISNDQPQQN